MTNPLLHHLTGIDPATKRATCACCGAVDVYPRSRNRGWMCGPAQRERMRRQREARRAGVQLAKRPYLAHRGGACERCRHTPLFARCLSVHHRNGDHKDNRPENLATLCLNCHAEVHALAVAQDDGHEVAA